MKSDNGKACACLTSLANVGHAKCCMLIFQAAVLNCKTFETGAYLRMFTLTC